MMTKTQINKLKKMMNDLDYPFEAPLKESFIADTYTQQTQPTKRIQ